MHHIQDIAISIIKSLTLRNRCTKEHSSLGVSLEDRKEHSSLGVGVSLEDRKETVYP